MILDKPISNHSRDWLREINEMEHDDYEFSPARLVSLAALTKVETPQASVAQDVAKANDHSSAETRPVQGGDAKEI